MRRRCTAAGVDRGDPAGQPGPQLGAGMPGGVADRLLGQPHPHPRVQFAGAISDLLGLGQIDPAFPQPGQHAGQLPAQLLGQVHPGGGGTGGPVQAGGDLGRGRVDQPAGRVQQRRLLAGDLIHGLQLAGMRPGDHRLRRGRHRHRVGIVTQHHLNRRHHQLLHTPHARRGVRQTGATSAGLGTGPGDNVQPAQSVKRREPFTLQPPHLPGGASHPLARSASAPATTHRSPPACRALPDDQPASADCCGFTCEPTQGEDMTRTRHPRRHPHGRSTTPLARTTPRGRSDGSPCHLAAYLCQQYQQQY